MKNRIGKNIRTLREANGETQTDLGKSLGFAKTTIAGYEKGERVPDMETLRKIAEHYYITVDELVNSDLINPVNRNDKISLDDLKMIALNTLPIICTEAALKNQSFKKGYYLLKDCLKMEKIPDDDIIVAVMEKFAEACDEDITEAFANLAYVILYRWFTLQDSDCFLKTNEKLRIFGEIKLKNLASLRKNVSLETLEKRKGFISDFGEIFMMCIKVLKSDIDWADLGDYYLAMQYTSGMIDSELSDEMNDMVGAQLMGQLIMLDNQYAIRLYESINDTIKK